MENENKNYADVKVYYDGSHYIGIPQENFPHGKGIKKQSKAETPPEQMELKEKYETAYRESQSLPYRERKKFIDERMKAEIADDTERKAFVEQNIERKKDNAAKRRIRLWRKVYTQGEWDYFVTFTFDSKKHTPESFERSLRNTLKHAVQRKGWKYIGVWERGSETNRLHFHGIFYIPENSMIGTLEQLTDYSTKLHRRQTTFSNTHFLKQFGRNDFKEICHRDLEHLVNYILKYIEKSGERLVYGGDLPTYFKSSILSNDIACPIGVDDKKLLLFDNFTCIDENGVVVGKVSPEVIAQMPKAN